MAFRCHPGAAGSVDRDLRFRQEGPQEQGIRDDTDIGADADKGDLPDLFPILIRRPEDFPEAGGAEGGFVDRFFLPQRFQFGADFPPLLPRMQWGTGSAFPSRDSR